MDSDRGNSRSAGMPGMAGPPAGPSAAGERGQPEGGSDGGLQTPTRVRSSFPETWIWADEIVDTNGQTRLEVTAPDTITSWFASAFAMHPIDGFGIAGMQAKTTVFKPFFVSLNLPYSVIRNEEFALQANVFNYMEQAVTAKVTLEQSAEFTVRRGGRNLDRNEALHQQVSQDVFIPAGEAKSVYFWIVPNTIGRINIQCKAQTTLAADAVERTLIVDPEGVEKEFTDTYFIEMTNDNSGPYSREVKLDFPNNAVEGSERVTVTVVGDILQESMQGIEHLIRMPYGCGEQNMVAFVPNIVALIYLNCTSQDDHDLEAKALKYMEIGYQRELTYKHHDGSYSAFGTRDRSGSLWLTSFVLKSFMQAKEYIYIDETVIDRAAAWILRHQAENGSFIEPGRVLSSYMQGGSGKGVALTAYTLIALCENDVNIPATAKTQALRYLESELYNYIGKPYILAIITYALHVCDSVKKDEAFELLDNLAINNANEGVRYWKTKPAQPQQQDHWYRWSRAKASDIELNAYCMLIYLQRDLVSQSLPMAKWLLSQRNAYGGFSSTQDTVMAMQALAELACKLGTSSRQNLQLTVLSTGTAAYYPFEPITDGNNYVLQRAEFPGKISSLRIHGVGQGVAVLQLAYQYNVVEDDTMPVVNLTVVGTTHSDYVKLDVCTSWHDDEESGMMIIEVQMLSGFVSELTKEALHTKYKSIGVKRVEINGKKIIFYLEELTSRTLCMDVTIIKMEHINDIKDAKVQVYQYYSPDQKTVKMYSLGDAERKKNRCDVCKECCTDEQTGEEKPEPKKGKNNGIDDKTRKPGMAIEVELPGSP